MGHGGNEDVARFALDDATLDDLLGELYHEDALVYGTEIESAARSSAVSWPVDASEASLTTNGIPASAATEGVFKSQHAGDEQGSMHKKPMVNSTRQRMKEELAYLRNKVVELELQLQAMTRSPTPASSQLSSQPHSLTTAVSAQHTSLWERVARHQRVEKQKAERRNSELRELLEDQLKLAKSLEKALRKRPSALLTTSLLDELTYSTKRLCTVNPQESSLFSQLTARVDIAYQDLESVWQRTGLAAHKGERSDTHVLIDDSNRLYLEVINAKVVPFSLAATNDAAWKCLSQSSLKFLNGVYHAVHVTSDSIHSSSEMWMRVGDAEARMTITIVTRRYTETPSNRVVYVLEASTVSGGARDLLHGLRLVERGWVVFEPVPAANSITQSTLIQVCMRLTPAVHHKTIDTPAATTGAITSLILAAFHQNLGILYQSIENMLVEQMLTTAAEQITVSTPSTDDTLSDPASSTSP